MEEVLRRTYRIDPITVNGVTVLEVIIDPHYEEKHDDHIDDSLILKLAQRLDGRFELAEAKEGSYS